MFSGHRRLPQDDGALRRALERRVLQLCGQGVTEFLSGGAMGFDLLAASAVLKAREQFPQVSLTMVVPCKGQSRRYPPAQKALYDDILRRAQRVEVLSEVYYEGCMLTRNRAMAERADCCLCYLTTSRGGTAHAVGCAAARGLPILNLAEDLQAGRVES